MPTLVHGQSHICSVPGDLVPRPVQPEGAGNVVALEDGCQMEVLSGRRGRDEVKSCLYSYARAVTGCDI